MQITITQEQVERIQKRVDKLYAQAIKAADAGNTSRQRARMAEEKGIEDVLWILGIDELFDL